jgi:superfamily II DNA or RNA helicase
MSKIIEIEEIEYNGETYNLHIENNHNYFANGLLVSNCHVATGKELTKIVSNCRNSEYCIGFTGSLKKSNIHELQLNALFGPIRKYTKTKELISRGILSKLEIRPIVLKHPKDVIHDVYKQKEILKKNDESPTKSYKYESETILDNPDRLKYIAKLAASRKQNTLILFKSIDYGRQIFNLLSEKTDKDVRYVDGTTKPDEREQIRKDAEKTDDMIIVASLGVFSTGVNIKNLVNIIFAESVKSSIKVIQSIGRSLRKHKNKEKAIIWDIVDDLTYTTNRGTKKKNYILKHFFERIGYYDEEGFNYSLKNVSL